MKSATLLKKETIASVNLEKFFETPFCKFYKTFMNILFWRVRMVPEVYILLQCVISKRKKQMLTVEKNCQICSRFALINFVKPERV